MQLRIHKLLLGAIGILFVTTFYAVAPTGGGPELTPEQLAGRKIYVEGVGSEPNSITATLSGTEIPGSILPCANCHGKDGKGKPEGGIVPTNVTWDKLTGNYGAVTANGRKHGPYTASKVKRAITMGLDADGNELNGAMPRYKMSLEDLSNLMAYLKILGKHSDMGIHDDRIKVGTILPHNPADPEMTKVVQEALTAYFSSLNETGGVYGRKVELASISANDVKEVAALETFVNESAPFAFSSCFGVEREDALLTVANQRNIPVVGAFSDFPNANGLKNPNVFYVYPGVEAEAKALTQFAINTFASTTKFHVVVDQHEAELSTIIEEALPKGTAVTLHQTNDEAWWKGIKVKSKDVVMIVGQPDGYQQLLQQLSKQQKPPAILVGLPLHETNADFLKYEGTLYYATRHIESVANSRAEQLFDRLHKQQNLSDQFLQEQKMAVGSAMLLVEMLRRIGKDVSRDRLVSEMERLYNVQAGPIPAVSYTANSRVGSSTITILCKQEGASVAEQVQTITMNEGR